MPGQGDLRRSGKGPSHHEHAHNQEEALLPRERVLRVTEEHAEEGVAVLEDDKPVPQPRLAEDILSPPEQPNEQGHVFHCDGII